MSIMIVREITEGADEYPAIFLACLTEAVQKYTNLISPPLLGYSIFTFNSSVSLPLTSDASFDN